MTTPTPPAGPAGPAPGSTTPTFTPPAPTDPGVQQPAGPSAGGQQPQQQPAGAGPSQQPGQQPGQQGNQQPGQGGDQRPPWERNGEQFDPDRAWRKIQALEADRDQARGQRDEHKTKLDEIERGKLSAQQQAEHDRDSYRTRAEAAEWELARHSVIAAKGLQPAAAEFLTGSTREELEASADRLLAWNPGAALAPAPAAATSSDPGGPGGARPATPGRPAEALTVPAGGSDPGAQLSADDLDPTKLAARIPRGVR